VEPRGKWVHRSKSNKINYLEPMVPLMSSTNVCQDTRAIRVPAEAKVRPLSSARPCSHLGLLQDSGAPYAIFLVTKLSYDTPRMVVTL
jgi:hypothetical protein